MSEIVFEGTEDPSKLDPIRATLEHVRKQIHVERQKRRRAANSDEARAAVDHWADLREEIACVAYDVYRYSSEVGGDIRPSTKKHLESEIKRLQERHANLVLALKVIEGDGTLVVE